MTRPKASRQPVSSFGPQLLAALLKGARERVEIPCPNQRTMKWLQLRLHTLRAAMQRERHPQYELVTRARTSRQWDQTKGPDSGCVLVIQPHDHQFISLIEQAGVKVDTHVQDLLDAPPTDSQPLEFDLEKEIATIDPYAKFKED